MIDETSTLEVEQASTKTKVTFKQLREFKEVVDSMFRKEGFENTKLGYAIKKFIQREVAPIVKKYNAELDDIQIEHALVDEKTKAVLLNESGKGRPFQYDKEGTKAVNKAENALVEKWDKEEFEVEPYLCKEPVIVTESEMEVLKGLVL